ncbi:hypothetical protein ACFQH6_12150 [Halobacteriaceae archaeon GCM10025711]
MDRRSYLKVAGVVGIGALVGFEQFRRSGREGRVFWRQMAVDADGEPGSLVVLTESRQDDGTVERTVHPDYRTAFENGSRVPKTLHRTLQRQYGLDEPYYLLRYEGHDCNGIPSDEGDGFVEVSRHEFNRFQVGDCIKR